MENANNNAIPVLIEHQAELEQEVSAVVAVKITVTDQKTYIAANDQIGKLQPLRKNIVAKFADPKSAAAKAHKEICALEKSFLDPVDQNIRAYKSATESWYAAEQARIRAEEERKRREAEEAAKLAAEAESAGDEEMALEAVAEAAAVESTITAMPKVKGTAMREVYRAVVVDVKLIPREYMIPDQALLNRVVQAHRGMIEIPGVRIEKSYSNSTRAK